MDHATTRIRWGRAASLGALAFLFFFGAGCRNLFRTDAAATLDRAYRQAVDARAVRVEATATIAVDAPRPDGSGRERVKITLTSAGATEEPEVGDARGESSTVIAMESNQGSGGLTLDGRTIGQTAYLQLRDARAQLAGEAAGNQAIADAVLGAAQGVIGNRWIAIDPREIPKLLVRFGAPTVEFPSFPSSEDLRARRERYRGLAREHPALIFREDLGRAKVDGIRAHHLRVGIRREEIRASLTAIFEDFFPAAGAERTALPPEVASVLDRGPVADAIDRIPLDVWIGKRDGRFVRVYIPLDLDIPLDIPVENDHVRITGAITIRYRDWGKPVTVEAPTDAKPLEELLGAFLGMGGLPSAGDRTPVSVPPLPTPQSLPSGRPPAGVTTSPPVALPPDRDTDGDGLSDTLEGFYGSDPRNPDTDGDSFRDGVEVDRGYSPTGPGRLFDFTPAR